jgi:hypothetical protein
MRRETVNFSMYSDMSIWMSASLLAEHAFGQVGQRAVLPTPVGPRKRKEPIGRRGILEIGAGAAQGPPSATTARVLADDGRLRISSSSPRSFSRLLLLHAR